MRRTVIAVITGLLAVISSAAPVYAATTAAGTQVPANSGAYTIHLKTLTGIPYTVTLRGIIDPANTLPDEVGAGFGSRFVAVVFTVTNRSEKDWLSGDPDLYAFVVGSDNQLYSADVPQLPQCSYFPNGGYDLQPGQSITGCIGYQLDNPVKVAEVEWTTDVSPGGSGTWHQLPRPTATVPRVPIPCQDQYADGEVFVCGPTPAAGYVAKSPAPGTGGVAASGPPGGASSPASVVLGMFNDYVTGQWTGSCSYYPPGSVRDGCVTGMQSAIARGVPAVSGTMHVVRVLTYGSLALVATTGRWCATTKSAPAPNSASCLQNTNPNEGMPVGGLSFQNFATAYWRATAEVFSPLPCALIHGRWYGVETKGLE